MKLHRLVAPIATCLLLAACAVADPNLAAGPRTTTDRFLLALADAYKALGDIEASENDPLGANVMYEKSGQAARGQNVPVGDPMEWDARRGHPPMWGKPRVTGFENAALLQTARDHRARLSAWIEATKARDPAAAAAQQVAFECWLEEMSEDHDEDAAKCGMNPASWQIAQAPAAAPAPAPAAAPAVPTTYLVFFDFDKSDITPEAARVIKQAADNAKRANIRLIVATGHADRAGAGDYNLRLSERRAAAVRAALVREGIAAGSIQTTGRGEAENMVPTADGVREPRNRRVEIAFR
jgi:OmpA-OmpF porin, OOP family